MNYCKKCVSTDTRPKTIFDDDGICKACKYTESIKTINWKKRLEQLKEIADNTKEIAAKRNTYDCAIGVSGGKDSLLQAIYARDTLGLNPLLVNSVPEEITKIGQHNIDNLSKLGFDMIKLRPNPNLMRDMIKRDFFVHCNPQKVTEYTLWSSVFHIALGFNIPLVIQGESQALTLGVETTGHDMDSTTITDANTIETDAFEEYKHIGEKNLIQFRFPDKQKLRDANIKGIYLQYFLKDWSWRNNAIFSSKYGLETMNVENLKTIGRYTTFGQLDSEMNIYNQMIKYIKFGFGFATDEASYDIRDGYITRDEGIALVKKYDGLCDRGYVERFCNYIDITVKEFWTIVNKHRGPMWENIDGTWKLDNPIYEQVNTDHIDTDSVLERLSKIGE